MNPATLTMMEKSRNTITWCGDAGEDGILDAKGHKKGPDQPAQRSGQQGAQENAHQGKGHPDGALPISDPGQRRQQHQTKKPEQHTFN